MFHFMAGNESEGAGGSSILRGADLFVVDKADATNNALVFLSA